jgi:integrase
MSLAQPRPRRRKALDAGPFWPEIGSFRLHLAAEGKAAKTVRTYTEAVQWFAAAHLIPRTACTRWDQVEGHDVQRWMVWLLGLYSDTYASNQYRALQQFFKWLAEEEQLPDPMARMHPPAVTEKLVPVFTSENYRNWRGPARAAASPSGETPRSSPCSRRPASAPPSWPGSATTPATRRPVT